MRPRLTTAERILRKLENIDHMRTLSSKKRSANDRIFLTYGIIGRNELRIRLPRILASDFDIAIEELKDSGRISELRVQGVIGYYLKGDKEIRIETPQQAWARLEREAKDTEPNYTVPTEFKGEPDGE